MDWRAQEPETAGPTPRWAWGAAAVLLALFAALAWVSRVPGVTHSNDDAIYVMLSQALRAGSYREIYHVGTPYHTQYPPGWPAVLAVVGWLSGDRIQASLAVATLLVTVGLALYFDAVRRRWPAWLAVLLLGYVAVSPNALRMGGRLMSEAAFFCCSMLALWSLAVAEPSRRRQVLATAASILAAFMRSAGITVIAALFLWHVVRRQWRAAALHAAVAAATFGPWLVWTFVGPRQVIGRSYAADLAGFYGRPEHQPFRELARRLIRIPFGDLARTLPFLPPPNDTRLDNLLWAAVLLGLGGAGLVVLWRRWRVVPFYFACYAGLLLTFTWAPRRFLFPLLPLVLLLLASGALAVWRRFGRVAGMAAMLALFVPVTIQTVAETRLVVEPGLACNRADPWHSDGCYTPEQQAFFSAAVFVRDSLPADATILVEREASLAYHTGRRVLHAELGMSLPDSVMLPELRRLGVTHVLMGRLTGVERDVMPRRLLSSCAGLEPLRDFEPGTHLLAIRPTGGAGAAADTATACTLLRGIVASAQPSGPIPQPEDGKSP